MYACGVVRGDLEERLRLHDRYSIVRRIGAGGFGVVFEALDRTRGERVALKTLGRLEPASLLRFKREFRAVADLSHPNVVQLFDLEAFEGEWFFTMELVDGVDFLAWVRRRFEVTHSDGPSDESERTLVADEILHATVSRTVAPSLRQTIDYGVLREALRQLAHALIALHDAELVHRDMKPSNVVVDRDGRVVLLDFGIAADLRREDARVTDVDAVVGTPAYMAPEQGAAMPVGPATDWYAVGVMLFEALTGTLPFQGSALQMLMDKQHIAPPRPAAVAANVPADLDALGALEGGERGAAHTVEATSWMSEQGVRDPAAITRMLVPAPDQ